MFEHSVRVPRTYKLAGNILQKVKENGGNLKSLLYQEKNRHFRVQVVHALVFEALKHENQINDLIIKTKLLINENRFDPWLARILITELLWGKRKLPGESKPEKTIRNYHKQFEQILETLGTTTDSVENVPAKEIFKPRYIRINTLRIDAADAVRHFQDEGWHLVRCTSKSYDDYLKQVENLAEDEFIPDFHVKVVFAFAPSTKFHNDQLYLNYDIFLQDKATALASYILSPTPGSTVLDMCAAPGMKTTHLAAIMKNEGTIYAIEQNVERYKVLCDFIESAGATCVKPINGDAAEIKKTSCPNVDYVLLDPSCSGSGIVGSSRAEVNDSVFDLESGRVQKLASFQAKLLRHTLNEFSTAKRVVYSTCSLYKEENEAVIHDVVRNHKGTFRLVSAKEKLNNNWNNVGDPNFYDIGEKCVYARPSSDLTCGFFIAVFENKKDEIGNVADDIKKLVKSIKVDKEKTSNDLNTESVDLNNVLESETAVKKTKKRRNDSDGNVDKGTPADLKVEEIDDFRDPKEKTKSNKQENGPMETLDSADELPKKKSKKAFHLSTLLDNDISAIQFNDHQEIEVDTNKEKSKKKEGSKKMELEKETTTFDAQNDIEEVKDKKNKKKKREHEENLTIDVENGAEEVKTKKSKKKKTESEEILTVNLESSAEVKEKKSKKKKGECKGDVTVDSQKSSEEVREKKNQKKTESEEILILDAQNSTEKVKDKKSKKRKVECEDSLIVDSQDGVEEVKTKKCKKKKVEREDNSLICDSQNGALEVKEKKSKKRKIDCVDLPVDPEKNAEEVKEKKSKKSKKEPEELTSGSQKSAEEVKTKKSKKKKTESEEILTVDYQNVVEEIEIKKSKKRKTESEENLTVDLENCVEVKEKKKKKK